MALPFESLFHAFLVLMCFNAGADRIGVPTMSSTASPEPATLDEPGPKRSAETTEADEAPEASSAALAEHPIIFFDGVCGMCNQFVKFILHFDSKGIFRFAPLQGETARRMLPPLPDDPLDWSLLYLDERGTHDQSDASLQIYRRMGGVWHVLGLALIIPQWIRTPVYRVIARSRYRVFGKLETCRVPTPEEKERFLP